MPDDGSINLNPLSLIDRLIREHGSASILRDHLSLLREQIAILQTKNEELQKKNTELHDALKDHKVQVDVLAKQISQTNQQATARRSETEEKLLLQIASNEGQTTDQLTALAGDGRQVVLAHLQSLENDGFVWAVMDLHNNGPWSLQHEGRQYLLRHGLLE